MKKGLTGWGIVTIVAISAIALTLGFLKIGWAPLTSQSPAPFEVWIDTTYAADRLGVDYGALTTAAYGGNQSALRKMMATTDGISSSGAGTYGHGSAMLEILWKVGEDRYLKTLKTFPPDQQKRILFTLRCGDEYTRNEAQKNRLEGTFPALSAYIESLD